jgi:hypothetical protein
LLPKTGYVLFFPLSFAMDIKRPKLSATNGAAFYK